VSDAGAPFTIEESPKSDYYSQLGRVRDILIDQTRALRKRGTIDDFESGRQRGAYWGIGTEIAKFNDAQSLASDTAATLALESMPTRLAKVPRDQQGRLINWGYALADAALRTRAKLPIAAATALPQPQFPLT
jgi:NTE family protein